MVTYALLRNDLSALKAVADEVARGLSSARVLGNDVIIQTPISFPSGRLVGIKLLGGPELFTVTDNGSAMREAEFMGAEDVCRREARRIAKEFDLVFNEWELFEAKAHRENLVGITSIVANAAAVTLLRTSDKFSDRFDTRRREELATRLGRIFGSNTVSKDVEFIGASTKSWHFDAQVALPSGRSGLFSVVTPAPISVAFAYSKMDDVSRVTRAPFLAAVLEGNFDPQDKALLGRAARKVFMMSDADETFRTAA